jgi:hypothetical protein
LPTVLSKKERIKSSCAVMFFKIKAVRSPCSLRSGLAAALVFHQLFARTSAQQRTKSRR